MHYCPTWMEPVGNICVCRRISGFERPPVQTTYASCCRDTLVCIFAACMLGKVQQVPPSEGNTWPFFLEMKLGTVLSMLERPCVCVTADSPSQAQTFSRSQQSTSHVREDVLDPSEKLCHQARTTETLRWCHTIQKEEVPLQARMP